MKPTKLWNKLILIYGDGELGKLAFEFFDFYDILFVESADSDENGSIRIDSFDSQKERDLYEVAVCISTASYNMIKDKLIQKGFTDVKSFFEIAERIQKENGYKHPLTNGWKIKKQNEKIYDLIEKSFKDNHSKYAYAQFFDWHDSYTEYLFNEYPINCKDRYFIPEVVSVLHDYETFVDAGAYDGRVSKKFIEIINGKYDEIFMFEPQVNRCIPLGEEIEELHNIKLYHSCLGNKNGHVYFNDTDNYLGKVFKKSKQTSAIRKLDFFDFKPTFIKYHLEGYELEALKGSIKTIKKYRPIIAVTTYHTEDGLYKIPNWLIKNCKGYRFYWRNHNYMGQGAVMYCIPEERYK